jgi:ACS family hexuronate transporter-like MFS transporter
VTLASAAGAFLVIYLAADLGSVFGGWLPAFFLRRGWSGTRARLATMALFAAGLPISVFSVVAKDLWTAVAFISIATACHQAWSANMFTVASDVFPSRAVGSVVGFGGMLMLLVAGGMLQWLGNFTPLFLFAGVMHPRAWISIRALVGKNIAQIDLDKGTATSRRIPGRSWPQPCGRESTPGMTPSLTFTSTVTACPLEPIRRAGPASVTP